MLFSIQTALKTTLEGITGDDGEAFFKNVRDHHTLVKDGFPYCTFEMSDFDGNFLDSCSNERIFKFNIIVLHVINKNFTRNTAKTIVYKALEKIIVKFDGDMDMGEPSIIKSDVSSGELGMIVEGEGQTLALSVNISFTTVTQARQ